MIPRNQRLWPAVGLLLAALTVIAACGGYVQTKPIKPKWTPASLIMLPYTEVLPKGNNAALAASPITYAVYSAGSIKSEAIKVLDDALLAGMPKTSSVPLIMGAKVVSAANRILRRGLWPNQRQALAALGRELKVDGVLVGYVYRFQEREGGEYAAGKAASVAFDLALVRSSDGTVVWKNSFDQTQVALSENVMRLGEYAKHGLRWLSAAEFARFGMDQLLLDFPWRKKSTK